ncbi:glycosyltransferase family 4 protein [Humitalea sp. 24SJ18S-53]|uniref:glycosyltransferase family 4 protein n=1 Tax=Humitalea sp. 24SJ18S-53 TaxID=3422307 RepID=UPI003D677B73
MTLWIDVEDLFDYARHLARPSGIQRLSFELYRALVACPDRDVGFVRHDSPRGTMRVVAWGEVVALYEGMIAGPSAHDAATTAAAEAGTLSIPTTRPLGLGPIRHVISRLPFDLRQPLSQGAHHQIAVMRHFVEAVRAVPSLWRRPVRPVQAEPPDGEQIPGEAEPVAWGTDLREVAQPGDTLACFGSPWFHPAYATLVSRVVGPTGMRFALLVYDLIPVLRPEFCDRGLVRIFEGFIRRCLPAADIILAISDATARDIETWAAREGIALRSTPRPIPIGTGFVPAPATALPEGLVPGGYALFVSTIEARKNHLQAFRIWRQMLEEMPRDQVPTLVFAGRVGWMVADLMQAIENTDWLDGKLVLVREPDDSTLSALYENCRFTLFTSHYEGWGLPVSESLAFGKTCIASDRTSVPEAGGPFCLYVDPENTTAAYAVVRRAVEDPNVVPALEARIAADYRPTPWTATAEAVLRAIEPATSSP